MTIQEWAVEGLNLAQEKGKSVDDLILFLRMASMTANALVLREIWFRRMGITILPMPTKRRKQKWGAEPGKRYFVLTILSVKEG